MCVRCCSNCRKRCWSVAGADDDVLENVRDSLEKNVDDGINGLFDGIASRVRVASWPSFWASKKTITDDRDGANERDGDG